MKGIFLLLMCFLLTPCSYAGPDNEYPVAEKSGPVVPQVADTTVAIVPGAPDSVLKKRTFFRKFLDYFGNANKTSSNKKFDFSLIGGPHYNSSTKLGLGVVAAGLYRTNRLDTVTPPSNVSVYGDITTSGFYLLGVKGNHLFPQDKYRLLYNLYFFSFPGRFWGVGYENGRNDANASTFKRLQYQVKIDFLFRLGNNLYLGPNASVDYVKGQNFERPDLLEGEATHTINYGVGGALVYDSRDFIPNAYRGFYLKAEQRFYPAFMGNKYAFSRTDIIVDYYRKVWKGGILACDFHTQLNYGNTPWTMMALLGGTYRMRGYYEGRYRDNNIVEVQIELRQNVWKRSGVVVWVGGGNVFKSFRRFDWGHTLPNYGIGYRWEFKKRTNVRLDYGFGKGESAFMFNINESF